MGRKRKAPTRVLSTRISEEEYRRIKRIADQLGKSISQMYKELIKRGRHGK